MSLKYKGFPGGSVVKNSPASAGNLGLTPGSGRSPGGGNGNPPQYSCLGNLMDRGAWQTTVLGVKKNWIRLNVCVFLFCFLFYSTLQQIGWSRPISGGQSVSHSPWIPMLISSKNALTDTQGNV